MKPPKRKRRKLRNSEVAPRSLVAGDEAPYIWTAKAALYLLKDAGADSHVFAVYQALDGRHPLR